MLIGFMFSTFNIGFAIPVFPSIVDFEYVFPKLKPTKNNITNQPLLL